MTINLGPFVLIALTTTTGAIIENASPTLMGLWAGLVVVIAAEYRR